MCIYMILVLCYNTCHRPEVYTWSMKSVVCPDGAIHLLIMANAYLLYEGVPNLPANGDPDQLGQVIRPAIRPHSRALLLLPHQPRLLLPAAGRGLNFDCSLEMWTLQCSEQPTSTTLCMSPCPPHPQTSRPYTRDWSCWGRCSSAQSSLWSSLGSSDCHGSRGPVGLRHLALNNEYEPMIVHRSNGHPDTY